MRNLAQPGSVRQIRLGLMLLLVLWMVLSLVQLFWALYPVGERSLPEVATVINPIVQVPSSGNRPSVDIEQLRGRHLFGEVTAGEEPVAEVEASPAEDTSREGIEKGARETRLQLVLRGVVASSEQGLGHAVIEHRKKQAVYAVEDELPVSGNVTLAKVMQRQVVLDNNGTYELLTLFEDSELGSMAEPPQTRAQAPVKRGAPKAVDKRDEAAATDLARGYRDRLYQNPQSLAEVVSISAVRQDGALMGYRIAPGKDKQQFDQLGFKSGDLVTSVNGIALTDPANTMRLYQTMRTASEAVFDLERGGQQVSVSVSLGSESE